MVRVAVASVDVLIVVLPRLRRPKFQGRKGWKATKSQLLNSSGRISVPGRLVVVPLPLLLLVLVSSSGPDHVVRVRLRTDRGEGGTSHSSINGTLSRVGMKS